MPHVQLLGPTRIWSIAMAAVPLLGVLPSLAQQAERHVISGSRVAVYNLARFPARMSVVHRHSWWRGLSHAAGGTGDDWWAGDPPFQLPRRPDRLPQDVARVAHGHPGSRGTETFGGSASVGS